MKTISMPLEEYEKELKTVRASGFDDGYRKGAVEMAGQIEERIMHLGRADRAFNDGGLAKLVTDTVKRIRDRFARVDLQP